jgi:hypothetical protein
VDRVQYLGLLDQEARRAEEFGERDRAAELRAQITRLSAGTATSPAMETTAARRPARSRR